MKRARPGYILLELVIALSIFSISVLGLANSLSSSMEVATLLNRESIIRVGLRSFIEEVRIRPLENMAATVTDEAMGVTYTSTMERLDIRTARGNTLPDLYNLTIIATDLRYPSQEPDSLTLIVYKPRTRR
jgi:type II secretory pathway pseudopilin PulG